MKFKGYLKYAAFLYLLLAGLGLLILIYSLWNAQPKSSSSPGTAESHGADQASNPVTKSEPAAITPTPKPAQTAPPNNTPAQPAPPSTGTDSAGSGAAKPPGNAPQPPGGANKGTDSPQPPTSSPSIYMWSLWGVSMDLQPDVRLILLIIFTGGLGACMSGLQSLVNFIGEKKLEESWIPFYFAKPPLGAGLAFIFYLVIRGGFLSGSGADGANSVNPYGVSAVAALVGLFSDKAFLKLREIALTIFKADDDRTGKLTGVKVTSPTTATAPNGQPFSLTLNASSGTPPYQWLALTPLPAWLTLDPDSGVLAGTPPAAAPAAEFRFQVTDSTGKTAEFKWTLTVT